MFTAFVVAAAITVGVGVGVGVGKRHREYSSYISSMLIRCKVRTNLTP